MELAYEFKNQPLKIGEVQGLGAEGREYCVMRMGTFNDMDAEIKNLRQQKKNMDAVLDSANADRVKLNQALVEANAKIAELEKPKPWVGDTVMMTTESYHDVQRQVAEGKRAMELRILAQKERDKVADELKCIRENFFLVKKDPGIRLTGQMFGYRLAGFPRN